MQPVLNIGIIGAGIGGLAASVLLAKAGHSVTVFDQFDRPKPIGSGLVIQPVGQQVLGRLGILGDAVAVGAQISAMRGHEVEHSRTVLDVSYAPRFGLAIHRASLFNLLLTSARQHGAVVVPGHPAKTSTDGVVRFVDGCISEQFDLVADASGAKSNISPMKDRALPYGAIWGTVPWPADTDLPYTELRQAYRRADRMMGVLPLGHVPRRRGRQAAIFWSMPTTQLDDWQRHSLRDWKDMAGTLWPAFAPFLQTITRHDQMTPARYTHGTVRKPYGPRLALIGDSAHRASPQLGQGANMALLDAMALAQALSEAPPEEALRIYATARRWHVRIYQGMSWAFTPQYQSDSHILPALRDRAIFPISQIQPIPRLLTRLVCGDMIPPLGSLTEH